MHRKYRLISCDADSQYRGNGVHNSVLDIVRSKLALHEADTDVVYLRTLYLVPVENSFRDNCLEVWLSTLSLVAWNG